ncbi:uncharacterized protein ACBR49_002254 isoform 2-T2 [Aulostomus maculatus]
MEQGFADLLSEAFSDTSVPSFPAGDFDFESLKFDEEKTCENQPTEEDENLNQEASDDISVSVEGTYMDETADFEQPDVKYQEEDYSNSSYEEESSASGEEDEEEEEEDEGAGDSLMSAHYEFRNDNKEDRIFAEGQPLALEGTETPQVRIKEQGESDEEVSYFGSVPERGRETMTEGDGTEEDKNKREETKPEESSDSECEDMKIERRENTSPHCFDEGDEPVNASTEFPEISEENLEYLIAEVDTDENVEKVKDFSGEEHQEGGESLADYSYDFSSCDYVENEGKNQESYHQQNVLPCVSDLSSQTKENIHLERPVSRMTWMGRDEDEEGDGYLDSRGLEMDDERFMSLRLATGEGREGIRCELGYAAGTECDDGWTDESEDEVQGRRIYEEVSDPSSLQDSKNNKKHLEDTEFYSGDRAASCYYTTPNSSSFSFRWDLDVSSTDLRLSEDMVPAGDEAELLSSGVSQHPADVNSYSAVQRADGRTTSPSCQGSLDDNFFFNTQLEASETSELGQLGDDEYEEERSWEQEKERIQAFYKFYNDSDGENGREGRKIKVQFCADPLSQVIQYETESDRESLSSSTDEDQDQNQDQDQDDLSSAETFEESKEHHETALKKPACDPPNTALTACELDPKNTQLCGRKHKCLDMLKLMLKMSLVVFLGVLMFWLATDHADWLSPDYFKG